AVQFGCTGSAACLEPSPLRSLNTRPEIVICWKLPKSTVAAVPSTTLTPTGFAVVATQPAPAGGTTLTLYAPGGSMVNEYAPVAEVAVVCWTAAPRRSWTVKP